MRGQFRTLTVLPPPPPPPPPRPSPPSVFFPPPPPPPRDRLLSTQQIYGQVGPTAGLDVLEIRKIFYLPGIKQWFLKGLAHIPVTTPNELSKLSCCFYHNNKHPIRTVILKMLTLVEKVYWPEQVHVILLQLHPAATNVLWVTLQMPQNKQIFTQSAYCCCTIVAKHGIVNKV